MNRSLIIGVSTMALIASLVGSHEAVASVTNQPVTTKNDKATVNVPCGSNQRFVSIYWDGPKFKGETTFKGWFELKSKRCIVSIDNSPHHILVYNNGRLIYNNSKNVTFAIPFNGNMPKLTIVRKS
ncbi:MAG: hypothetical protein ACRCXZ_07735 [Patescibacteria group bacterium]